MVVEFSITPPQATRTAEQGSGRIGDESRLAQSRTTGMTRLTSAATRYESRDDMVADDEIGDPRADFFDDTRAFVAEHHG